MPRPNKVKSGPPPTKPPPFTPSDRGGRDPADIARERSGLERKLVTEAEEAEVDAGMYWGEDNEVAENYALTRANNHRLRAICEHMRIGVVPEPDDGE